MTLTIADIGRHIHARCLEYNDVETAKAKAEKEGVRDTIRMHKEKMDALMTETELLQNVILTQEPKTLADAAVQAGILFYQMSTERCSSCEEDELRDAVDKMLRCLPGIARVVARVAEIELFEFCPDDIGTSQISRPHGVALGL